MARATWFDIGIKDYEFYRLLPYGFNAHKAKILYSITWEMLMHMLSYYISSNCIKSDLNVMYKVTMDRLGT